MGAAETAHQLGALVALAEEDLGLVPIIYSSMW